MKLKITDEKLDELAVYHHKCWVRNPKMGDNISTFFKEGFRAAEQVHQATADKLLQIVEMQRDALNEVNTDNFVYDDYCTDIGERVDAAITKSDKMLKELND